MGQFIHFGRLNDMPKPISILTDPIPTGRMLVREGTRRIARTLRDSLGGPRRWDQGTYRGHFAVTRSLVEGLQHDGYPFNYNPVRRAQLSHTVVVLAGVATLRQAIELKRQGQIKRLLAGPNIVIFSSDDDNVLASPEIDLVVTPCDWVVEMYLEDNPSLADHIWAWPAGVDTKYWRPVDNGEQNQILIFEKQAKGPVGPVEPYAEYLIGLGETVRVLRYGQYTHDEFLNELQRSKLMVGFVTDESQGLAWAEAWSADVPTLLWRNETNVYRGRKYHCSTAPYLTESTGLFFDDLEDFKAQFVRWRASRHSFRPRDWVLENMSDEVCARALYERAIDC